MAAITVELDLPTDVTVTAYQRYGKGHGFEVAWPMPSRCRCERCHWEGPAVLDYKNGVSVIRDLDVWDQPSFWIYTPAYHRCPHCDHRQHIIPPFKRKDVSYTYRFEQHVLRLLIGSNEEEVARRVGISAETVALIVRNQLADHRDKQIDPQRRIADVGIDELSLKKRHKLYATLLTDLSDADHPEILAVAEGRDEAAARQCLEKLAPAQREQVHTYRADMSQAYHNACHALLPSARPVVDRFHVAKKFNEAIDQVRKTITHDYKAKLSRAERKHFRSLMWEFRRRPEDLSPQEKAKLEELFRTLPRLRTLYEMRVRFQTIFDTATNRRSAHRALLALYLDMLDEFPELEPFIRTFETWQEEILNYFEARQTSGPVEGINNKARVILKRAYGLKDVNSLWTRLILDLNRATEVVSYTLHQIQDLVRGFRSLFAPACT